MHAFRGRGLNAIVLLAAIAIYMLPLRNVCAEENSETEGESVSATSSVKSTKPQKIAIDSLKTVAGFYYGFVSFVHPDGLSIVVIPQRPEFPRRTFMLDRSTAVREDKKSVARDQLTPGTKVAVRYFGEPPLYLADSIFIVSGDFEPKAYQKKVKYKKSGGSAGAKKEGGGH